MQLLKGFSAIENYKKLKDFTPRNDYLFIDFEKAMIMISVLIFHRVVHLAPQKFDSEIEEIAAVSFIFLISYDGGRNKHKRK